MSEFSVTKPELWDVYYENCNVIAKYYIYLKKIDPMSSEQKLKLQDV